MYSELGIKELNNILQLLLKSTKTALPGVTGSGVTHQEKLCGDPSQS